MIDTLTISKKLRTQGFNEVQADEAINQRENNLATRDDIKRIEQTLEDKIDNVRGEIASVWKRS